MTADPVERLTAALADRYTIERELGSMVSSVRRDGINKPEQGP